MQRVLRIQHPLISEGQPSTAGRHSHVHKTIVFETEQRLVHRCGYAGAGLELHRTFLGEHLPTWLKVVLSFVALGSAAASAIVFSLGLPITETSSDLIVPGGIALAVVGVLCQVIVQVAQYREASAGKSAEDILRFGLKEAIHPLAGMIAQIPLKTPAKKEAHLLAVAVQAVSGLCALLGRDLVGVRACVFKVDQDGSGMSVLASYGRGEVPRPFLTGTPRGDGAMEIALKGEPLFKPNIDRDRVPGWEGTGSDYKGYISCPIKVDNIVYGMLTFDVSEADVLREEDKHMVVVVTSILGAAFTASMPRTDAVLPQNVSAEA